jgi:hypothetical protein
MASSLGISDGVSMGASMDAEESEPAVSSPEPELHAVRARPVTPASRTAAMRVRFVVRMVALP